MASNEQRIAAAGLTFGAPAAQLTRWQQPPSASQQQWVDQLDDRATVRVRTARMQSSTKRQSTALGVYEDFLGYARGIIPFTPLQHAGDLAGSWHNERALMRYTLFARETRWIKSSTVSAYTSSLKGIVELEFKGPLLAVGPGASGKQLRLLHLQMRREDGPSGERTLGLPLRMEHIRRICALTGFDRRSRLGCMRHALRHAMLQAMLRPGEAGTVSGQPFQAALHIVCGPPSLLWKTARQARVPTPVVILMVAAIKDVVAKRKRTPNVIAASSPAAEPQRAAAINGQPLQLTQEDDPTCPYQAIENWYVVRKAELVSQGHNPSEHPLFVGPTGEAVTSSEVSSWVDQDVTSLGLNAADYRGNAWRIGAATDLLGAPGNDQGPEITVEAATAIIKQRGRWWSDIYQIYSRWSVTMHATASRAITAARGIDMETLIPGFVQPGQ